MVSSPSTKGDDKEATWLSLKIQHGSLLVLWEQTGNTLLTRFETEMAGGKWLTKQPRHSLPCVICEVAPCPLCSSETTESGSARVPRAGYRVRWPQSTVGVSLWRERGPLWSCLIHTAEQDLACVSAQRRGSCWFMWERCSFVLHFGFIQFLHSSILCRMVEFST